MLAGLGVGRAGLAPPVVRMLGFGLLLFALVMFKNLFSFVWVLTEAARVRASVLAALTS